MPASVILTGSTGNLGTYLLAALVQNTAVEQIWCLNRSSNASGRMSTLLSQRGLSTTLPSHVTFLAADLSAQRLGLGEEVYQDLLAKATLVIHSAWPVNFNLSFESFEPSIWGVRNLIELAKKGAQAPRIYFISSISAAGNWTAIPGARHRVPEAEIDDWKVARFGYGQSKLVAERLLAQGSRASGVTAAVCRVGQVGGPVDREDGAWPAQEWLPSLITSSNYLGLVPRSLGPLDDVDWIPVDRLAAAIVELSLGEQKLGTTVFHHLANPTSIEWKVLVPAVLKVLQKSTQGRVKLVDLPAWVDALEASAARDENNLSLNPAVKLLAFFQNLKEKSLSSPKARAAALEMKQTRAKSQTLAGLGPVQPEWMSLWLGQWGYNV